MALTVPHPRRHLPRAQQPPQARLLPPTRYQQLPRLGSGANLRNMHSQRVEETRCLPGGVQLATAQYRRRAPPVSAQVRHRLLRLQSPDRRPVDGSLSAEGTDSEDSDGRFVAQTWHGADYRTRYWNDAHFDALDKIRPLAQKLDIPTAEAALRWMIHHSALKKEHEDAIITCASSAKQLEENLISLTKGPLPEELVQAFEEGWKTTKGVAAAYFF